ncbi:TPA: hypothetical protein HA265_08245 [Candidatus Woesearchaeota archaeon]|nr:hypothetical protein [Candidatus Woesearchaeota archaeon]
MPFDPNLDKDIWSESIDFDKTKITVAVKSYNDGPKKLQIGRENRRADGEASFAKLGRMTKEEAEAVLPLFQKALEHM